MSKPADVTGVKLGMWLFLYTEIMLFGGLFVLYAAYYSKYTEDFIAGGKQLDFVFGVFNTIILLFSSFLVASSITAIRRKAKSLAVILLLGTLICALIFLVNKYFEWSHKFEVGIYPNSEKLLDMAAGQNMFFGLYYVITGLHGVHIVIGMCLLLVTLVMVAKNKISDTQYAVLENSSLYWHLVDLIWIFIFPLFYLIL